MEHSANARPQPKMDRSPGRWIGATEKRAKLELRIMWEGVENQAPCHRKPIVHGALPWEPKSGPPGTLNAH